MANLRNFAKTYLVGTYGADDTLFRVVAGGGDRLPTVPFSATVWNSTDYSFASDDPFVEIVTVTEISGDFLTVARGAETTDATPKNLEEKTYVLAQTVTAAVAYGKQDMATEGSAWRIKGNNLQLWNPDTNGFHTTWLSGSPPVITIGPLDTSDFDVGGSAGTGVFTGTKWFTGEDDPDENVTGADVGDFYINSTSNDFFEKTSASAWTQRGTFGSGGGGGGGGDVDGPGSSTSGNIATFSSSTGKVIGDSGQSLSALVSSVAGKETAGAADDAIADHLADANPHTQYALASALSAKGDFFGPGSSTADDLVAFSNTTGKLGKAAGSTAAGRALLVASTALAQKIILDVKVGKRQLVVGPAADTESGLYDGVTDGTADEVQINAAASSLNSLGGGTVVVRPGNYTVADSVLLYSKVVIQLQEGAVIKPVNSFSPTNKPVIGTLTIRCIVRNADTTSGNSDVGIYGPGRITAEGVTGLPSNTSGQDSFVGILLHKVSRWHIDKLDADNFLYTPSGTAAEISDVRQYGIMLSETTDGVMTGSRVRYSGNDNISIRRSSKNNTIIGNHFSFSRYGHSLGQVCSGSGLIFGSAGTDASDNAFIGNYVEGDRAINTQQQGGITCHGGKGTLIHGNRIKNCGDGVVVIGDSEGCSIVGNRIYAPVAYGIAVVSSDTADLKNVIIASNTIQFLPGGTNEVGVYLWCISFDIDGCSIVGNRIIGSSGSGQKGVFANGAGSNILDLEITGNTFKNLIYGIHGDTTDAASSIGRCFIRTNMFRECTNSVIMAETTAAGTISNGVVDGNVINSTLASAIGIQLGGVTNYNVKNNRIIVSGAGAAAGGETTGCDLNDWIDNRTTLSTSPTFTIVGGSSKLISLHDGTAGVGDALTANPLSQFAATTSAQLAGVISDETGASGGGLAVFNNTPNFSGGLTIGGLANQSTNGGIDIASGGIGLVIGADSAATTRTNSTTKVARVAGAHYTNSVAPSLAFAQSNGSTTNALLIGGGSVLNTSATSISFYTNGVSSTDLSGGTVRMSINSSGVVNITGSLTLGTALAVAQGGTGATTAKAAFDNLNGAEATIASATTTDIGAASSDKVSITGTTTITGFGTVAAGVVRKGRFTGALTLTHNATSLILPGGANITTVAGDRFEAVSLGSGNWVVYSYEYATHTGTGAPAHANSPSFTTPTLGVASATSVNKWAFTAPATATTLAAGGDGLTYTFPGETCNVGYREIPQNSQSAAYTCVLADNGKHIYHPSADTTARTWTIPANASVAYPVGATLTFINDSSAGTITISITTDTLVLAGTGSTGSRTLAANGIATATKITSTRWIINGTGLT